MSDATDLGNCYYCGWEFWDGEVILINGKKLCENCAQAYNDGASSVLEEQA